MLSSDAGGNCLTHTLTSRRFPMATCVQKGRQVANEPTENIHSQFTPSALRGLWPAHQGGDAAESSSPVLKSVRQLSHSLPEDIWGASPVAQLVKNLPAMQETGIRSVGQEDALEKEMATHSSILAWEIPRTEDSGRLQFIGSKDLNMTWRQKQHGDAWGPQQKDRTPRCQTFS